MYAHTFKVKKIKILLISVTELHCLCRRGGGEIQNTLTEKLQNVPLIYEHILIKYYLNVLQ